MSVNLYWVSSTNHGSDCLVFAESKSSALGYLEHFDTGVSTETNCRLVIEDIQLLRIARSGFLPRKPNVTDLRGLGFKLMSGKPGRRTMWYKGETFIDGYSLMDRIQDDGAEDAGMGRPHGTRPGVDPDFSSETLVT